MTHIIVALPKLEDAKNIKNILIRSGIRVTGISTSGLQVISQLDGLHYGIVVCGYKLSDMLYSQLNESLPAGFSLLLIASKQMLSECDLSELVSLSMPLKVNDFVNTVDMMCHAIERKRKNVRGKPKVKNEQEQKLIKEAKEMLMDRNNMTEQEAYRYIQKNSMDSATNMAETAEMILTLFKG